ncbi:MAG: tetratricopeptide repeat protein [Chitinispirillaceae bacterium]
MASQADAVIEKLEERLLSNPGSHVFPRVADSYRKQGDIEHAIEICITGIEHQPDSVTGRLILGRCYLEQENFDSAVKEFKEICRLDRRNQTAIKMIADIYSRQGLEDKASDLYSLLLRMDPDNPSLIHLSKIFKGAGKTDLMEILGEEAGYSGASNDQYSEAVSEDTGQTAIDPGAETSDDLLGAADQNLSSASRADSDDHGLVTGDDIDNRMDQMFNQEQTSGSEESQISATQQTADTAYNPEQQEHSVYDSGTPDIDPAEEDDDSQMLDSLLESSDTVDDTISGNDIAGRLDEMFSDGSDRDEQNITDSASGTLSEESLMDESEDVETSEDIYGAHEDDTHEDVDLADDEIEEQDAISGDSVAEKIDSMFDLDDARRSESEEQDVEQSSELSDLSGSEENQASLSGDDISTRIDELFDSGDEDADRESPAHTVEDTTSNDDFSETRIADGYDLSEYDTSDEMESDVTGGSMTQASMPDGASGGDDGDRDLELEIDTISERDDDSSLSSAETIELGGSDMPEVQREQDPFVSFSGSEKTGQDMEEDHYPVEPSGGEKKDQLAGEGSEGRIDGIFGDTDEESVTRNQEPENVLPEAEDIEEQIISGKTVIAGGLRSKTDEKDAEGLGDNPQEEEIRQFPSIDDVVPDEASSTDDVHDEKIAEIPDTLDDTIAEDYESDENQPFSGDDLSDRLESIFGPEEDIVEEMEQLSRTGDGEQRTQETKEKNATEKATEEMEPMHPALDTSTDEYPEEALDVGEELLDIQNEPESDKTAHEEEFSINDFIEPSDVNGAKGQSGNANDLSETTELEKTADNQQLVEEELNLEDFSGGYDRVEEDEQDEQENESDDGTDILATLVDDSEINLDTLPPEAEDMESEPVSEFYSVGGGDALDLSEEDQELLAEIKDDSSANSSNDSADSVEFDSKDIDLEDLDMQDVDEKEWVEDTEPKPHEGIEQPDFDPEAVPSGAVSAKNEESGDSADDIQELAIPDHVLTPTLADIYFQQGQPHLAVHIYERLLEKDPDNERIEERIGQIRKAIKEEELREKAESAVKSAQTSAKTQKRQTRSSSQKKSRSRSSRTKQSGANKSDEEKPLKGVKIKKKVKEKIQKKRKI